MSHICKTDSWLLIWILAILMRSICSMRLIRFFRWIPDLVLHRNNFRRNSSCLLINFELLLKSHYIFDVLLISGWSLWSVQCLSKSSRCWSRNFLLMCRIDWKVHSRVWDDIVCKRTSSILVPIQVNLLRQTFLRQLIVCQLFCFVRRLGTWSVTLMVSHPLELGKVWN